MSPRRCLGCGTEEVRTIANGREQVNLEPVSGCCVSCLSQSSKEARETAPSTLPFDAKAAAAGKDE